MAEGAPSSETGGSSSSSSTGSGPGQQGLLDRLFAPQWAGSWGWARVTFAVAALAALLPRFKGIGDCYGVRDMVFSERPFELADTVIFTQSSMTAIWGLGVAALVLVLRGGALTKPAVLVYLVSTWLMLANEALNIKAYDRLLFWMSLGILLGPTSERGLTGKWRSPAARWYLTLVFCALYGSTGWLKALKETEGWLNGDVLSYHLVHQYFGLKPVGVFVSTQQWITAPSGWVTVAFECLFPVLIWFRRTNPWVLLVGFFMHLGILVLMNVGPFSYVAVAAYPALLHPEVARSWHRTWHALRSSVRDGEIADVWKTARAEARLVVEHPELAEALHQARTRSSDEA